MITMSMPVFNITNGTQTSWDLIGVAGLDVPISEILNEIPFYRVSNSVWMTSGTSYEVQNFQNSKTSLLTVICIARREQSRIHNQQ